MKVNAMRLEEVVAMPLNIAPTGQYDYANTSRFFDTYPVSSDTSRDTHGYYHHGRNGVEQASLGMGNK